MTHSANSYFADLLERVSDFLEPYVDIRDGSDGPLPNAAMSLQMEIEQARESVRRSSGPLGPSYRRIGHVFKDERGVVSAHIPHFDEVAQGMTPIFISEPSATSGSVE